MSRYSWMSLTAISDQGDLELPRNERQLNPRPAGEPRCGSAGDVGVWHNRSADRPTKPYRPKGICG